MRTILIISACLIGLSLFSQTGKPFPALSGTDLNGKTVNLPFKNGKQTVVGIAYHRSAEEALKKWLNPLYQTFIKKEKGQSQFDVSELYDVNFAFVPMISGFKKIANEFKSGTEKEFWPYIIDTEKTDIGAIQEALGVKDNKIPYFYVLDKDGKILEVQSGNFTDAKMEKLEDACGE